MERWEGLGGPRGYQHVLMVVGHIWDPWEGHTGPQPILKSLGTGMLQNSELWRSLNS